MLLSFSVTESHTWLGLFNLTACLLLRHLLQLSSVSPPSPGPPSSSGHPIRVFSLALIFPSPSCEGWMPWGTSLCRSLLSVSLLGPYQPASWALPGVLNCLWGLPPVSHGDRNRWLSTWNMTTFQFSPLPNLVFSKPFPSRWMLAPFWEFLMREPLKSFFHKPLHLLPPIYSSITFSRAHIQSPRSSQFSPLYTCPLGLSPFGLDWASTDYWWASLHS